MRATYRYLLTRLLLPLMSGAAACIAGALWFGEPWKSLLMNVASALIGSIVTVFYIDAVVKRQRESEWESVRLRTNNRLTKLGNAGISTVRLALRVTTKDVFRMSETATLAAIYAESLRIGESLLPSRMEALYELDEDGWKTLAANLRNLSLACDQLLTLFGRELEAEVTRIILDIQTSAESAASGYLIFPDLMGVPNERLPRKRDGSFNVAIRDAWTKLAIGSLTDLCQLSTALLRKVPPVESVPPSQIRS